MKQKTKDTLGIVGVFIMLISIPLSCYFINNYYLGWLLVVLGYLLVAISVILLFASGSGVAVGVMIIPIAVLFVVGNLVIDLGNKDDGIIVNINKAEDKIMTVIPKGY